MVFWDFNLEPTNPFMTSFMDNQNFKGVGSCFDLILKSRKYCFKNTLSYEIGISDHHHLIFSIMKTKIKNLNFDQEPKKFVYCNYKTFSYESFKNDLMSKTDDEIVN